MGAWGLSLALGRRAHFEFTQERWPYVVFFVGVTPPERDTEHVEPNHSPRFYVDEAGRPLGVRALAQLTCDTLEAPEALRRIG